MRNFEGKVLSKLLRLLVVLFAVIPIFGAHGQSPAERELRVGFVLPLSGEWAFLGNGIRDGALLAMSDASIKRIEHGVSVLVEE